MFYNAVSSCGLKVIGVPISGVGSMTILVMFRAGTRYENTNNNGVAHFIEHMLFKGGKKYKSAFDIAKTIDGIGGEINAFTEKEATGYYIKVAIEHVETAMDLLSDILFCSKFENEEIIKERDVIKEEIKMYEDTPMYRISDILEEVLYKPYSLGLNTLGTVESLNGIERNHMLDYMKRYYSSKNAVVSVSGNIEKEDVINYVDQYFSGISNNKVPLFKPFDTEQKKPSLFIKEKKTDQVHLSMGFRGLQIEHPDSYALKVMNVILGGNMSSRLFQIAREKKGLVYTIDSKINPYSDTGYLEIYAGCAYEKIEETINTILAECRMIAENGVSDDEIYRAKEYLNGSITLKMEDTMYSTELFARQALFHKKIKDIDEIKEGINSVSKEDIISVSKKVLDPSKLNTVIIGNIRGKNKKRIEEICL